MQRMCEVNYISNDQAQPVADRLRAPEADTRPYLGGAGHLSKTAAVPVSVNFIFACTGSSKRTS